MKNYSVYFTELANQDLFAIWSFIDEKYSPDTADSVIDDIQTFCLSYLSLFPEIGKLRNDLSTGVRYFPHQMNNRHSYNIFYRIENESIYIHHIAHGSQDYTKLFSSE